MLQFRKLKNFILLFFLFLINVPVYSKSVDVDQLFRNANLQKLIGTNMPVSLEAQLKNPHAKTHHISDMDDFVAIGVIAPLYYTVFTEFDRKQTLIHTARYDSPWMGVAEFNQKEIPQLSLQDGLYAMQACMAQSGEPAPDDIMRVIVYKTLNTSEMIYDYVSQDPYFPPGICREFLYSPSTGKCQIGMLIDCRMDI
jgi:hypothetical protein